MTPQAANPFAPSTAMPDQHSLADVLDHLSSKGKNFTFCSKELRFVCRLLFKSTRPMLNLLRLKDLFLVSINHKHQHEPFVFFKMRLDAVLPDIDIPSLFRLLASEDFSAWDLRIFNSSISWLRAGHLDPLSSKDHLAKDQVKDYLYLHSVASRLKLPTVQNHIIDVIRARKTCHQGWFDASLVSCVYKLNRPGDGLRRFFVDSFVYKSYRQIKSNGLAKAYWTTHRSIVLAKNMAEGNTEFVTDQADVEAAVDILRQPCTSSPCHYHNHASGTRCTFAASGGYKRKR